VQFFILAKFFDEIICGVSFKVKYEPQKIERFESTFGIFGLITLVKGLMSLPHLVPFYANFCCGIDFIAAVYPIS